MAPNEYPITLTTFPRLGTKGVFTDPYYPVAGEKLRSQFVPDEVANPHIRFPTLAANIRSRRGRKVEINVPVYRDENTAWPFTDPTVDYDLHRYPEDDDVRNGAVKQNCIYMDAMAFGMGSCCLQITFQAKNLTEGRTLYDQLSPLGPVMLALTAATPLYKGFLADTDIRWNQISASVDDRTPEELGEKVSSLGNIWTQQGLTCLVIAPEERPMENTQIKICVELYIYLARPSTTQGVPRP
jgi:glutamate--cysteine ligase catalytic subunit